MKYQCIDCGERFGKKWPRVEKHFKDTNHKGTRETTLITYKCLVCQVHFTRKILLKRHVSQSGHNCDLNLCATSNYTRKLNGEEMKKDDVESSSEDEQGDESILDESILNSVNELSLQNDEYLHCKICSIKCPNAYSKNQHLSSKKHRAAIAALGTLKPGIAPAATATGSSSLSSGKKTYLSSDYLKQRVDVRPVNQKGKSQREEIVVLTTPQSIATRTYDDIIEPYDYDVESDSNSEASESKAVIVSLTDRSVGAVVSEIFYPDSENNFLNEKSSNDRMGYVVGDADYSESMFHDAAYFGRIIADQGDGGLHSHSDVSSSIKSPTDVYLNTFEPFCFATVGIQGAGKSHTLACLIESCLIPLPVPEGREIVRLHNPMAALVFHYEQNESSICEATGLISPLKALERACSSLPTTPVLARDKMVVLVSPSYYRQRKAFYGDYCIVKPLLFSWASLNADHIKKIMRINENDTQLYVAAMLDLLRKYQRDCVVPDFQGFLKQIEGICSVPSQASPLRQRTALLESLVAESALNASIAAEGCDIISCLGPGVLVVADMTDPLLSSEEANGIFQVLTEKFRTAHIPAGCGKLLALDEAHKFMKGDKSDGLSNAIVNAVRLMRHDGMRVAISTQSPLTLAPELLELVSLVVLHRFHSHDWFQYLKSKIPLDDSYLQEILHLSPGTGLMFASRHHIAAIGEASAAKILVRPRITADRGASRKNEKKL